MLKETKYSNPIWKIIDDCSYWLMLPWLFFTSFWWASYIPTTNDTWRFKVVHYLIIGPMCAVGSICFLPLGVIGFILWLALCSVSYPSPYSYWNNAQLPSANEINSDADVVPGTYTVLTANICLLPEFLSRYNNLAFAYQRSKEIARRVLDYCKVSFRTVDALLLDHSSEPAVDFGIGTEFYPADFICFQEVWERATAWLLMSILRRRYKYFLFDVGQSKLWTNFFCLGSGLMFASRYRILDADFHSFDVKTRQSSLASLGLLQVKVELHEKDTKKQVGYLATTHLQSYQGKKPCILSQLDQVVVWLRKFRKSTLQPDEEVAFDILCGDFNFDNMSPGDAGPSNHTVFEEYVDPCRIRLGCDESWAIGTEMRQRMLWSNDIDRPDKFKRALEDPALRRYFLLDADVKIQTIQLAFMKPPFDENGRILAHPCGGMRRIDYVLYHKAWPVDVLSYNFVTAFNQLTDHIPVTMTFRVEQRADT